MSRYPDLNGSQPFTVETLRPIIPDMYVKAANTDRVNNTFSDDPELSSIALGVGTWHIRLTIFWSTIVATCDFKTAWTFSGTWNNPTKLTCGPSLVGSGNNNAVTDFRWSGQPAATSVTYGGGTGGATSYYPTFEETADAQVTVAGNLALQWAQNTTDAANATRVAAGSWFQIRQIA